MAAFANLSREEKVGLWVAGGAHIALAMALVLQDDNLPAFTPPERINVSLATQVSLESTSPDPSADPAAAMAPTISADPVPDPTPQIETVQPAPLPDRPAPTVRPQSRPRPQPRPSARPAPAPTPTPRATATQAPRPQPTQTASASRMNDDFVRGMSDGDGSRGSPARTFGPAEQSALRGAITRQLKPHWSAPSGVDADQLITVLAWELNENGSLRGRPRIVSQSGINDSNRPQAALHAERAIRAVTLAAPFNLPDDFYPQWRRIREWRFDRRL